MRDAMAQKYRERAEMKQIEEILKIEEQKSQATPKKTPSSTQEQLTWVQKHSAKTPKTKSIYSTTSKTPVTAKKTQETLEDYLQPEPEDSPDRNINDNADWKPLEDSINSISSSPKKPGQIDDAIWLFF